ncbi:hypothetical protein GW17_00032806 [Ensete ventricosum]|nr:hypothetical protein GW17_00032806 [Ensete ventricosum]
MASRGATLVLRTSWFNRSSWIYAKEITSIIVLNMASRRGRGWLPLRSGRGRAPPPCELALATTSRPFAGGLAAAGRPFEMGSLAAADRPYKGAVSGHARLALARASFTAKTEIVYPCIPYPNGEDEGGQASSSLAVSTRWISTAKLLLSDLATLAQREGGE